MSSRWSSGGADRSGYDDAWKRIEAAGGNAHGEADLVHSFEPRSVLDAGCGTGRVAIELARRGVETVGVDLDPTMLDQARRKAPNLEWVLGDLATVDVGRTFDAIVMAGNVMIFVAPDTEGAVVANLARQLARGGVMVAGFQLDRRGYGLDRYDADAATAGLELEARWSTWERDAWSGDGAYAVSVHRRAA